MFFLVILPIFSPFPFLNFFSKSVVRFDWIMLVKFKLLVFTQNFTVASQSQLKILASLLPLPRRSFGHLFSPANWKWSISELGSRSGKKKLKIMVGHLVPFVTNQEEIPDASSGIMDFPSVGSRFLFIGFLHLLQWIRDYLSMDSCIPLGDIEIPLQCFWITPKAFLHPSSDSVNSRSPLVDSRFPLNRDSPPPHFPHWIPDSSSEDSCFPLSKIADSP